MGRILLSLAAASWLAATPALAQDKGGEDETGAYEVVANWPQPWSPAGYIWGSQPAVFAQSPDRVFIGMRGEIKAPQPAPRGFNGSWGSTGQRATEPPSETRNCIVVIDRSGHVMESWTQWDKLFEGGGSPHKIRISPYDPQKHVWVVNDGKHVIHKFTNDGKQLVMTIGETGVPGDDATHFGSPQDLAFLPDGSILVADGLRNARIAKFDKNGKFVSSFGARGNGPGQLSGVHGIAIGKDGRIYVADRSNRRIQVFDESGKSVDIWPNLRQPNDIFISDDGHVWVVDGTNARLLQFDKNGKRQYWWGAYGMQPGQFWEPHQISIDSEGSLYIADSFGGRTQKYVPIEDGRSQQTAPSGEMNMDPITRRGFVGSLGAVAGVGCLPYTPVFASTAVEPEKVVHTSGDGIGITPREYATLLNRLCQNKDVEDDNYLLGGEVEDFERHWAKLLGKETAVFMPSGTLANQLALRALAGTKRRVIVPEMSHIYNDTGDACQTLSNLTLMPLAPGRATFTRVDVEAVLTRTAGGRVATDVGAIVIESPIRRLSGQMFDWEEAKRISALARDKGIGMHLDGARLFMASAYTGISPAEYSAQFDTVYVSLWKYFNCGIGAILAGPKRVLDGMFHVRRMFGGNLAVGWNAALVARHFMDGFEGRLKSAVQTSETLYAAMAKHPKLGIERIPNGTNLTRVSFKGINAQEVGKRLAQHGIAMSGPAGAATMTFGVNETWNRLTAAELVRAFEQSLT